MPEGSVEIDRFVEVKRSKYSENIGLESRDEQLEPGQRHIGGKRHHPEHIGQRPDRTQRDDEGPDATFASKATVTRRSFSPSRTTSVFVSGSIAGASK